MAAPTGSGKTLAAFLFGIDDLVKRAERGELERGVQIVYLSPLKALSTDVEKNLVGPLAGIREIASATSPSAVAIRTALRTGDTTPAERAAIVRDPPHILVTTPESLYLMLTAKRTRALLESVRAVIVDELHALMRDKRGSHLALSLARLDAVARTRPQRIGLSATVRPIEEAARFLSGRGRGADIVDVGHARSLDVAIEVPFSGMSSVASREQWAQIHRRVAELVSSHTTTLVFVNTRRQAERIAHELGELVGEDNVSAHHGSLSKDRRLAIERRLKSGAMRAIVATASLELGIDVGAVDLVCQIGSPRSMSTFLQRLGRSGHGVGRTAVGRLFPTTRDDLLECAAVVRGIRDGHLDRTEPPVAPVDILAQQLVAECAARDVPADELFELARSATPYADLPRAAFDEMVAMLAEGPAPRLGTSGALLFFDPVEGMVKGRRRARLVALENGGAIPELADYRVVLDPDETFVGTVNEDWAIESAAGDVFLLGSHAWKVKRVESRRGVMRVVDANGAPPSVPFWLGEAPARTWEHSLEVSRLRADIVRAFDEGTSAAAAALLARECGLGQEAGAEVAAYVVAQRDALGIVPTMDDVVFERFFDEAGGMQLVVHAPFGARVNRAFGLALRKRFCVSFDFELQAAATDDAIVLSLGVAHSFPLTDAFHFVRSRELRKTMEQAVLPAPMFATRFRWNATRSLSVARMSRGKKVQPFLQRMRTDDLLAAVFPAQVACQENTTGPIAIPDHPLVRQTLDDCFTEAMDIERLRSLLERMERGEIRLHARDTTEPSPFSHEVLSSKPYAFLDDAPLEERRARAVSLRRTLPESQRDLSALDPAAIERVRAEVAPRPRDEDELRELVVSLVLAPRLEVAPTPDLAAMLDALAARGSVLEIASSAGPVIVAAELADAARLFYHDVPESRVPSRPLDRETALAKGMRGYAEIAGPFTARAFAARLGIDPGEAEIAAGALESEGIVLRGSFTPGTTEAELCERRLLARIHRGTIDRLRAEIEPVSAQDFMRFLFERHRLSARSRAGGRAALRDAIQMLQGYEIAAARWEQDVLAARVSGYRTEWLDELCLSGEVAWARLSVRRRVADLPFSSAAPSKATPITLLERESLDWMLAAVRGPDEAEAAGFEATTRVLEALRRGGALFFHDLARITRLDKPELREALWDLVARGLATADGFQPLRDLIGTASSGGGRIQGRFSLLARTPALGDDGEVVALGPDGLADRVASQLLSRWGVVFRDLYLEEPFSVPWRDVLRALRRREARGLVRGGLFVSGFLGEQYALAECVDALRRIRRTPRTGDAVTICAADPLNLVGVVVPGTRVPANEKAPVHFVDGAPVADTTLRFGT